MLYFVIGFLIGSLVCSWVESVWEITRIRKYMKNQLKAID